MAKIMMSGGGRSNYDLESFAIASGCFAETTRLQDNFEIIFLQNIIAGKRPPFQIEKKVVYSFFYVDSTNCQLSEISFVVSSSESHYELLTPTFKDKMEYYYLIVSSDICRLKMKFHL